ncbi:MAG TPA: M20/M25/M40 family metallo-hydrolase [Pseudonocardiaceae bacterium]
MADGTGRTLEDDVVELCSRLIRFDTTNHGGGDAVGEREAAEYVAGVLTDAGLEPKVLESAPRRANVVARIPGADPDRPALLVHGHLDVVPAEAADWSVHPFSGEVRDGYVWGRGAVDMKDMLAMVLAVARHWAATGRRPQRDVVLAFVADEEDRGDYGAHWLVTEHPELFAGCTEAVSESGGFSYPVRAANGRTARLYPVATAERGSAWLKLVARGTAGHASRNHPDNAVLHLTRAMTRLGEYQWPVRLTPAVQAYLERVGAALGVEVDLSDVDGTLERLGTAAEMVSFAVRNSSTPTFLRAGYKVNVRPSEAIGYVDGRVLPGTRDEFLATVDELLGPQVRREFLSDQPPVQAPLDTPLFDAMAEAVQAEDPEGVVVPFCMGGGTDAKAFAQLGIAGYGFTPMRTPDDFPTYGLAHGVDERVPVSGLQSGVRMLERFLRRC